MLHVRSLDARTAAFADTAADPPQMADKAVSDAASGARAKAAAAQGYGSTLLTGGQGLSTPANTTQKTLLGA